MEADRELGLGLRAYRRLYLVRASEETIRKHYNEDEMKTPVHLSIGQEAVAVGVCEALDPGDRIFATYRSHAVYLARTGDTDGFFGELYGRVLGAARGKAGSMHLAAPHLGLMATSAVVATTIPLALGAAFSSRYRGEDGRAVVFFGDGAVDEGVFWESLNFACVQKLPVVFVCEDNGLAIHSRAELRHGYDSIADLVSRFRCAVLSSEATDPIVIRDLVEGGFRKQNETGEPLFLHLRCYRFVEHVGPELDRNYDLPYRDEAEFEYWSARDPIHITRSHLAELGATEDQLRALERSVDEQVQGSLERAQRSPRPGPEECDRGVYA